MYELVVLLGVCAVCFGDGISYYRNGSIYFASIDTVEQGSRILYRPGIPLHNAQELNAHIVYVTGKSELAAKQRYNHPADESSHRGKLLSWDAEGEYFYSNVSNATELKPCQWYVYTVDIYRNFQLVYRQLLSSYKTPSMIESCINNNAKQNYSSRVSCSELLLKSKEQQCRLRLTEATTKNSEKVKTKSTANRDNNAGGFAHILVLALAIPVALVIFGIIVGLCCQRRKAHLEAINTRPAATSQSNPVEISCTQASATTPPDNNNLPPAYESVVYNDEDDSKISEYATSSPIGQHTDDYTNRRGRLPSYDELLCRVDMPNEFCEPV